MEERTNYLLVGVFVLGAVVVSIGFTLWIADVRTTDDPERYIVVFERDVSGLSLGSPVRYLGVDVGQVADLRLITNKGTRVAVTIDVGAATPVDRGTYASLAYQGITGVAFISLAADAGEHPPLTGDGAFEHPVIPTRDVGLAALLAESGNITSQVGAVLDRINELLGDDNRASIGKTLANLESLTDALAIHRDSIERLPGELLAAVDELQTTLTEVNTFLDDSRPDLLSTVEQLRDAAASIASVTDQLDSVLDDNHQPLDEFIGAGLGQLPGLVAETRHTLREIDKLLASLREDPSQLIHRPRQNTITVEP